MSISIISRATWGARPWNGTPATIALSQRTEFFVHYDGGTPITRTGYAIMRAIETEHLGNGWAGVGYNFVVDQAGNIYEGRGWSLQGAHCPGHNVSGLGVQIAIGGDQEPTAEALAACRALYDEACRKTGHTLAKKGHRDGYATQCPGAKLYAWVKAGMPAGGDTPAPKPPAPPSRPSVSLAHIVAAARKDPAAAQGHTTYRGEVLLVEKALHAEGYLAQRWVDGSFGSKTVAAYAVWQQHLGYRGADADGIPGMTSLKKLGARHSFDTTA